MTSPNEMFRRAVAEAVDPTPPGMVPVTCQHCGKPSFTRLANLLTEGETRVLGECCRPGSHYPKRES